MSDPLNTAAADLTTEADKLRTEMATELATLESSLRAELAKARAQITSPHGHMIFGMGLFVLGMIAATVLHHL